MPVHDARGPITAVLGPTNTGKTHLAVERMLGHATGMIGCPLRLLAREIYDRVAALRGSGAVALITGEEKIIPDRPRYFVCTVESMPLDVPVEFLAVDEIQLAADPERGHVFTDRLLHARGLSETMFLGAETIRPMIKRLVPRAEFLTRPRFSSLSYVGPKKITKLPRRSAVIAFSANAVYELAEVLRRQRGGTAVVLGALSPRTRNAQVAMYQAGEVDYLVATDAIGMGLNMDVDHVAFSSLRKFDGRHSRDLSAQEIAQIAGRAGRHMRDGTFGTLMDVRPLGPEIVEAVEQHRFPPLTRLYYRNSDADFASLEGLIRSLETAPPAPVLVRAREATDLLALRAVARQPDIARIATGYDRVRLLWEVCQIPDFSKTLFDSHARLLAQVYRHLAEGDGRLPADWVARHVDRLDRTDGDIDALVTRIAHVRTWNYVAHRPSWVADSRGFQARTRAIEDRLSDALHDRLTQRFVDRRNAVLIRRLDESEPLIGAVTNKGEVVVEGEFVGRLKGFDFAPDEDVRVGEDKALRAAANRALKSEIGRRVAQLANSPDDSFALSDNGLLLWDGDPVARLSAGPDVLSPAVEVLPSDYLDTVSRERVRRRLADWLAHRIAGLVRPLFKARKASLN
ncbi:MAG: disulfide oxidoreductase, partial [Rhodospirillaceae bacterium]|nr:disulfide oxidoreductase [Rhodospirillaceae bacterium]